MTRFSLAFCTAFLAAPALAIDLSNNLSNATSGVESATNQRWLCASFGTGASAHTLNAVTLKLANTVAGSAALDIYTNSGQEPGVYVGTLNPPAVYSPTLASTTFTTAGIELAANTTYWVVLAPQSGQFDWAWTADSTGTGVGFQYTWGNSDETTLFWWTQNVYPVQMSVVVDSCVAPGVTTSPEESAVCAGATATFTAVGSGTAPLSYRWRRGNADLADGTTAWGSVISGSGTATLRIAGASTQDAASYSCRIINDCGTATTSAAALRVCAADFNCDGFVDFFDVDAFNAAFEGGDPRGDFNRDGFTDFFDIDAFIEAFETGC